MSPVIGGVLTALLFLSFACQDKSETPVTETAAPNPATTVEAQPVEVNPTPATAPANDALFGLSPITSPTAADLERGARVYKSSCVRCHNPDPNQSGSLGPSQVDAPFEVVVSKIMTGKYPDPLPAGFTPKRKTRAMTPLRSLKADIPYIHAWIQSVRK